MFPASDDDGMSELLDSLEQGEQFALDDVLPVVYGRLKGLANRCLAGGRRGMTMEATALVHEAYLKLRGSTVCGWSDRQHFFGLAATVMRQVLVDHVRARDRMKRESRQRQEPLEDGIAAEPSGADVLDLLALDDAVNRLRSSHARKASVVDLRFFASLTIDETAKVLGVSNRTVELDWRYAQAWLARELDGCK